LGEMKVVHCQPHMNRMLVFPMLPVLLVSYPRNFTKPSVTKCLTVFSCRNFRQ
jgi:hypothetical protein